MTHLGRQSPLLIFWILPPDRGWLQQTIKSECNDHRTYATTHMTLPIYSNLLIKLIASSHYNPHNDTIIILHTKSLMTPEISCLYIIPQFSTPTQALIQKREVINAESARTIVVLRIIYIILGADRSHIVPKNIHCLDSILPASVGRHSIGSC